MGQPVGGALVTLLGTTLDPLQSTTGGDGAFEISVKPGPYQGVSVKKEGFEVGSYFEQFSLGDGQAKRIPDIILKPLGKGSIYLTSDLPGVKIYLYRGEAPLTIDELPPGEYDLIGVRMK